MSLVREPSAGVVTTGAAGTGAGQSMPPVGTDADERRGSRSMVALSTVTTVALTVTLTVTTGTAAVMEVAVVVGVGSAFALTATVAVRAPARFTRRGVGGADVDRARRPAAGDGHRAGVVRRTRSRPRSRWSAGVDGPATPIPTPSTETSAMFPVAVLRTP